MVSVADQIKKLKDEARKIDEDAAAKKQAVADKQAKLLDAAKDEVMLEIKGGIEKLKDLNLSVFEIGSLFAAQLGLPIGRAAKSAMKATKAEGSKRTTNTDRECPVCQFNTVPHHDGRKHKNHPEPFTAAELKELGMVKA